MQIFANLFLILFIADGGFSLVDELVPLISPLMPFTAARNLLAETVVLMAIPLYICLAIDQRLPKKVFLPLIIFVFLCPLSVWLIPELAEIRIYGLLASAAQLLLGMLPLRYFRQGGERSLTMPPEMFAGPFFGLRNTLIFCAANLPVIPLALALLALSSADTYMAGYTAGFMRLHPSGLRMTERVYRRDERTIRLAAMIHVGNREYYRGLTELAAPGRVIVLAEGVSDKRKLLQNRIDYGKLAGYLGLTAQKEMLFKGRLIEPEELDTTRPFPDKQGDNKQAAEPDILRADLDISDFRPETILILDTIGKHLRESPSFVQGITGLNSWAKKSITPEMSDILMDDILHHRNRAVISHLDKALKHYDTVVIPWGALHMKEIEAEVLKRGFRLQYERKRVSINFLKMLSENN